MSTPYVGLNRMTKPPSVGEKNPWCYGGEPTVTEPAHKNLTDAKRRLVSLLDKLGVETVQVGLFQIKLSETVPTKHLIKATHYLLEQLKAETPASPYFKLLESCLCDMLCS